jgi:hypothetical protein
MASLDNFHPRNLDQPTLNNKSGDDNESEDDNKSGDDNKSEDDNRQCFVPHTLVEVAPIAGNQPDFRAVENLHVGDCLLTPFGTQVEVAYKVLHTKKQCALVTLQTAQAVLTVTPDHRIVVPSEAGASSECEAGSLKLGDMVFSGRRQQPITKVVHHKKYVELVELRLSPDEAVEGRHLPLWGVLSKGAQCRDSTPITESADEKEAEAESIALFGAASADLEAPNLGA